MKYGLAIRVIRSRRKLSQKDLANQIGVNASFLSLLEAGKRQPSTETLEDICKVLQVPMYLLMLLASEKKELKGISSAQAAQLGQQLLNVLLSSES